MLRASVAFFFSRAPCASSSSLRFPPPPVSRLSYVPSLSVHPAWPLPSASAPLPHLRPFAFRATRLASDFCFFPRFVLHDKKRVLFCEFTEANFFATWGNAENRRSRSQKSTEKWGVFIMGDFVVREVDRVRRTNKAILGCTWNRRCACVFVVRCNREVRCKARKSLRKLPIRRSLAKLGEAGRKRATHSQGKTMRKVLR